LRRYKFNDEAARTWLAEIISKTRDGNQQEDEYDDLPSVGPAWNPLEEPGGEDDVFLLVRAAQEAGVLSGPPGAELDFEFTDDTDGGYYRFLLELARPARLKLASYAEEWRKLVTRDACGADAALEILREAEITANQMLRQLVEFIDAGGLRSPADDQAPQASRSEAAARLDARLDSLGTLRADADQQIALISLLAIGQILHQNCPLAATVVLEWSDQGPYLTAVTLLDNDNQPLDPPETDDALHAIEPYCANLGEDNEPTWGAYIQPGTDHGQPLLLRVTSTGDISEPAAGPTRITYGAATLTRYLADAGSPASDMYVLDLFGLRVLVRLRDDGTFIHIDTQDSAQPPLMPLAVEVNNGGESTYA